MESVLSRLLRRPEAQEIVREMARHIKKGNGPAIFANLFLEVMRDPKNDALRRDACAFLMFAASRGWEEILKELKPAVDGKTMRVLRSPSAALFYQSWVLMVRLSVEEYFKGELQKAKAEKRRKKKTG